MIKKTHNKINILKKTNKTVILLMIPTFLLISIVMMTSYAWFNMNVIGNEDAKKTTLKASDNLEITFVDGAALNAQAITPGWSGTKTFSVTNTGDKIVSYKIAWKTLTNNFIKRNYLKYSISSTNSGGSLTQTQIPDSENHIEIIDNITIPAGVTQTYTITFSYLEANLDQSIDKKKELNGMFEVLDLQANTVPPVTTVDSLPVIPGIRLGDMELSELTNRLYPIGSVYTSFTNTNPGQIFGGTWQRVSNGQTLVGVDSDDGDFAASNLTGGSKTHSHTTQDHLLTTDEIPSHTHIVPAVEISGGLHVHSMGNIFSNGSGSTSQYETTNNRSDAIRYTLSGYGAHTHGTAAQTAAENTTTGSAHNHGDTTTSSSIQPFITVYRWKRVS